MDFLRKLIAQIGMYWGKWSMIQRIVLVGIVAVVIVGIGALLTVSSSPSMIPVIDAPIRDEAAQDRIVMRLNQEGVKASITPAGVIMVQD